MTMADIHADAAADFAVRVLNRALEEDRSAVEALMAHRVPCNKALADDPTIQVKGYENEEGVEFTVGLLGFMNGILGKRENGYGYVAAVYDVVCPTHGKLEDFLSEDEAKGLVAGDACPKCESDIQEMSKLRIGSLVKFVMTPDPA